VSKFYRGIFTLILFLIFFSHRTYTLLVKEDQPLLIAEISARGLKKRGRKGAATAAAAAAGPIKEEELLKWIEQGLVLKLEDDNPTSLQLAPTAQITAKKLMKRPKRKHSAAHTYVNCGTEK
jgi:hypothetical protein